MASNNDKMIGIPEDFSFPYPKPYDIQLDLMRSLYKTLELKKIGIFESPTGSGKSLSLICGSLTWLKELKEGQYKQLEKLKADEKEKKNKNQESSGFDWLTEHEENFEKNQNQLELKLELEKIVKQEKEYKELKTQAKLKAKRKRFEEERKVLQVKPMNKENDSADKLNSDLDDDELDIILDDYSSDEDSERIAEYDNEVVEDHVTKIYYCSRTHSQLSQFIGELQKTKFSDQTRLVTLGSRMNLCINDTILKLGSLQIVNDTCLELQKTKKNTTKTGSKKSKLDTSKACPYYKPNGLLDFRSKLMEETYDIEDVVKVGRESKICPYYGSRHSIPIAELIALPYNILFQKETRESFSINLKNQIIIIDEAHNLIDTITQINSVEISNSHITQSLQQLNAYIDRYNSRLSAKNLLYCKQLVSILNGLNRCFSIKEEEKTISAQNGKLGIKISKIWSLNEFFSISKLYNSNLIKVLRFCDETKLEKKLIGFQENLNLKIQKEKDAEENKIKKSNKKETVKMKEEESTIKQMKCPLMQIKQFIKVLSTPLFDGRILLNIDTSSKSTLKYVLLNPNVCFDQIIKEARSVILAGGTMKPVSDFEQLISEKSRIEYFSCGHVIPKENLLTITLGTSSNGVKFDFSYNSRDNTKILDELGNELIKLCSIVPAGIVVFFVSYDYLDKVVDHFKKTNNNYIINKISEKKQMFFEPRLSQDCEKVFSDYTKFIKKCVEPKPKEPLKQTGAILFAVIGGKMSEGINFSDELGRCVVVVGQPFPNIKSLELQEKMQYLNQSQPKTSDGKQPGKVYYENLCWKAINQSIGRAIRHQNDYATILLLDLRFSTTPLTSLKEKLPKWIGDSVRQEQGSSFAVKDVYEAIHKFYDQKKIELKSQ